MSRNKHHPSSFAYHAQAIGFSASLYKPCCENVPGQASVSLSQTGGESYAIVRNFDWKGIFRFDEAAAYVTGSEDHDSYNTLATVTVRGLNIANMVTADLIIARVSSRHDRNSDDMINGEGSITLEGSAYQNLRVAGRHVSARLATPDCSNVTFEEALDFTREQRGFVNAATNTASCSLATGATAEDLKVEHGKIVLPEFGTIYLAGVIFKPSYRRISMLRVELGCPLGGGVEVCGGEGNGTEIWP
jgi:hypothetical protein